MPVSSHRSLDALHAAYHAGDMERVVALGAHIPLDSDAGEAVLLRLGIAQHATSRHAQAAATFRELTRMCPQVSAYWNNLALASRQAGDLLESERALMTARALAPGDAEVLYNLGLLQLQQHRWISARQSLMDAVQLAPQFIEARLQAAHACHVCGDNDGQQAMLVGAGDWPPQAGEQALILAAMLSVQGDLDGALRTLAEARIAEDDSGDIMRLRLAAQRVALHERSNQLERAHRDLALLPLERLDTLPPDAHDVRAESWSAHAILAAREGNPAAAAILYRKVLALDLDDQHRAGAAFGLAAASDRLGRQQDALQALHCAHTAQLAIAREVVPELLQPSSRPLAMSAHRVDHDAFKRWKQLPPVPTGQQPVFVVGFPRSGTTLLEQMLDAHPDFCSMDERGFVHELTEGMELAGQPYPEGLADLDADDARQLRELYFRRVAQVLPDRGTRRLVDKNPLNMLCLPMIMRLFPQARIILCLRHPCDVLLSCYMQPFRSPAFMAMCSSLQRLAEGYVQAFEQWQEHAKVFSPRVLEWRYESVVDHFDASVTSLGEFLGVADASSMARFSEHARGKRFISTPSYAQVTQGISRKAVNRWHAYRDQFEPVLPMLRPVMHRMGYAE